MMQFPVDVDLYMANVTVTDFETFFPDLFTALEKHGLKPQGVTINGPGPRIIKANPPENKGTTIKVTCLPLDHLTAQTL